MKNMSADRRMIKIAMAAPYLDREEEHDLAVRWKDARGSRRPQQDCNGAYATGHLDGG